MKEVVRSVFGGELWVYFGIPIMVTHMLMAVCSGCSSILRSIMETDESCSPLMCSDRHQRDDPVTVKVSQYPVQQILFVARHALAPLEISGNHYPGTEVTASAACVSS